MSERDLFIAALQISDPSERSAWIDRECGGDAALRERVEVLMQAFDKAGSLLESPVVACEVNGGHQGQIEVSRQHLLATIDEPISERPGTVIGPFKLLEQIGEGGFGVVFMAEQTQPLRRKVALKVLKPGMDTRQVIARFEAERQALALMDHPNIAKVLDAGQTTSGRPYFVMDLVRGLPITEYCDQGQLTLKERLELFIPVCQAVQHAHHKGIIHRDLKPSNVLVTLQDGAALVKVIDFGIAKALGQQLTDKTLFTGFAQLIGTPLYMSPEQTALSNVDVDTRSDIYSLGVLLYELLTGTTPFDTKRLQQAGYDEMRRIIREEEPPKPSTRISTLGQAATTVSTQRKSDPRRLSQLFRGELDWIVMKALEKDRNRRYESASGFARDIERYLHDEPVQACPPSAWYRLRKLARRNKRVAVMASLLFAMLVVAVAVLGVSYAQVRDALQEKTRALDAEQEALQEKTGALQREQEALQEKTQTVYYQNIALAERQLAVGNVGRAEELLNNCSPHLRGWEWHFLKRQRYGPTPPLAHSNRVERVAFSPDGRHIASGCLDGTIQIWDTATGSVLHHLHKGQKDAPMTCSLTYSLDGQHLAAADYHGDIRVWRATTGELLAAFRSHETAIWNRLAFSPDGRTLASAAWDGSVKLWDLGAKDRSDADRLIGPPLKHPLNVSTMAFSPDGGRLLTACLDGMVRTWDLATGQEADSFPARAESGYEACFSRDVRRLAWTSVDGTVKVWDTATRREEFDVRSNQHWIRSVAFSPDGRRIALGGGDGTVRLLDGSTGRETLTIYAHSLMADSVAFSPDGYRLASASKDHTVRVWDATPLTDDPQAEHCVTLTAHKHQVRRVAFSPDSRWLASASLDGTAILWELLGKREITRRYTLRHRDKVVAVSFSPDNRTLASASGDNTAKLWDLQAPNGDSLTERRTIPLAGGARSIAFNPDGRLLAISQDGGIAIHDPATGKEVYPFKPAWAPVPGLAFGPDGRIFSSGASDPYLKVWDVAGEKPLRAIPHPSGSNVGVAVSSDGRLIASGGPIETEHLVQIWDAQTGLPLQKTPKGHLGFVWTVAFSPDSRYLASGSYDSTVKVWDLKGLDSAEPVTLRGHTGFVYSVAFSPDGRRLASASGYADHGEVKVWDAAVWERKGNGKP
jgi:WD40 repeat protein/serine/threonine protein kinase